MARNMQLIPNMGKPGSIGIDVGGTKTLFALFNDQFQVLEEVKLKTEGTKQAGRILLRAAQQLQERLQPWQPNEKLPVFWIPSVQS
jgi:predicted NBD/HSP70 family sugar kinase